jgi:hypothetical protein
MVSVSGIVSFLAVLFVFVIIIVSFVFNPAFNRGLLSVREAQCGQTSATTKELANSNICRPGGRDDGTQSGGNACLGYRTLQKPGAGFACPQAP